MTDFLTSQEAGSRLGVTVRQVQKLAKAGLIPAVRKGRRLRIPRAAWETWVADQAREALDGMREGPAHAKAA